MLKQWIALVLFKADESVCIWDCDTSSTPHLEDTNSLASAAVTSSLIRPRSEKRTPV